MDAIQIIYLKLNAFYKKFYINKLLKGCMLFVAIGLLYFIFTSLLENFLWLHTTTRAILFFVFLGIEILLFVNFIGIPLFQLNKIAKGISYQEAAEMLQKHFPDEVGDKLKNVLQLNALQANNNSDLLAASIQQKTDDLKSVPFTQAINFKSNLKFVPFLALPFLVLFLFFIGGKIDGLFSGFHRVAQYDQVFEKPAPFVFVIENANLAVKENEDFTLNFKTTGNIIPDAVTVNFNNQSYYAEKIKPGYFKFTFNRVGQNLPFYLEANSFTSKSFTLQILPVPAILDLQLQITTPKHVGQNFVKTSNSGNVLVPEGSVISWEISANHTDQLVFISDSVSQNFNKKQNQFTFSKKVLQALPYQLVAKNNAFHYDQQVSYQIEVIKDQFPQLSVQQIPDSIAGDKIIFHGKASDDYGISALRVVYYDVNHPQKIKLHNLPVSNKTATSFVYAFPDGLQLQPEISYSYYFEVLDNDAVNHFKATQSNRFVHNELNAIQKLDHNLTQQMDNINALQKSLSDSKNADKKATEVNQLLKQTTDLDYKGIKKLQDFFDTELQNQKAIDAAAQKFAEKLAEKNDETDNEKAKELEKRLENLRKEQELNKKLYEQLQKYTDKLTNEDLLQLMEQAKQNSKQQKRSLEQLVEQTKRFYVEQKAEQLGKKIADLASRQEKLQTEKQTDTDKQEQLNKAFDAVKKELQDLDTENKALKKPMDVPNLNSDAEDTAQQMDRALEKLQKQQDKEAKENQQKAAEKMKEMAKKLEDAMQQSEMDQLQEDAKMLRQILKNLLTFSFSQENTMKAFKANGTQSFHFNRLLKEEQKLKNQFQFIDDSLYTLASRQIRIQDVVNKNVGEVHYNIEQALHHLVENNLGKGISHQQYVMNHANVLADLLSDALSNMQNQLQMQSSGKGKPSPGQGDPQLSDIIQKQKGLEKQFQDGLDNKEKNGDKPGDEKGNKPENGAEGEQAGKSCKNGLDGDEAESEALLEIYKEQQRLREAVQKALQKQPGNAGSDKVLDEMKKLEQNLLNQGFSKQLVNQFKNLNHELLKLETAFKQQGDDDKRQSSTNTKASQGEQKNIPQSVLDYINTTEMLQKNSLPLLPKYDNLVKEYFK